MRHFPLRSPQSLISSLVLWTSFFNLLSSDFCYTQNTEKTSIDTSDQSIGNPEDPKYMINFNNVPVIEVIRFVSKISHTNFVFDEAELGFNVTIISEESISVKNITSALIQVLRIHDLRLLEQNGNLTITKSGSVNQIPTLILPDSPDSLHTDAPIVTRVFRIKNASPSSIAGIIKPMVSTTAQVEVSAETRQLIVTDILTNVDQVANLLVSLDTPNTRLEIESYVVKHIAPSDIISLTQQILSAFAEGNPLILVPQQETNTIFIVSTPYLIERALTVMEDVDTPSRSAIIGDKGATQDLHIYKILNKTPEELLISIQTIYTQLQADSSGISSSLLESLKDVKLIPNTNSLIFVTDPSTWDKVKEILAGIDVPFDANGLSSFWVYKIQGSDVTQLEKELHLLAKSLNNQDLSRAINGMKWVKENNSLVFTASASVLAQLQQIVPSLDSSGQQNQNYFIYKIEHSNEESLRRALIKLGNNLQNKSLEDTVEKMKWIEESNSLVFNGPVSTIDQLKSILPTLDISSKDSPQSYIYPLQTASKSQAIEALKSVASGLDDSKLADVIDSVKWIKENNSLLFTGNAESLAKLKALLPSLDLGKLASQKSHFIIYNPVNQEGEVLYKDLEKIAKNLSDSGLENNDLLSTLNSVKWNPSSNSIIFTGNPDSLERVQKILTDLDKKSGQFASGIFLYSPQQVSPEELKSSLTKLEKTLKSEDPSNQDLIQAIQSSEIVPETNSILFKASEDTLSRIKQLIATLDTPGQGATDNSQGFFLYKLQEAPGNAVIQHLKDLSEHITSDDPRNAGMIKSINSLKWVKENNSILITGSAQNISLVKTLISEFDIPSSKSSELSSKSEFFIYKPISQTPEQIKTSLAEFAIDLETSDIKDASFIRTLKTPRIVAASKTLVFTGTSESIAELKTLLTTLDDPSGHSAPIQTIGNSTFLIYKIQNTPATDLMNSLQTFGKQLGKSEVKDKALASCLNTVKWIKETNSLLFTGSEETLLKVEKLIEKFDIGSESSKQTRSPNASSSFFVYNPRYQSGDELIHILNEFEQNLMHSGVSDPGLFDAINHLKFISKTNSLIVSGDDASIGKVQELLLKFDVLGQGATQPEIATIDDTNFLIYKLQYHKGLEIQMALKKIASSLASIEKATNKNLTECIASLQWIEVTNSLLGTGDASTLEKVKGLISNLDVPLKQVFIEVLVIETSIVNSQSFGLQWGSQLQYLNKTVGAMGNFPPGGTDGPNILQTPLNTTTAASPPVQGINSLTSVPFTNGFDIGVIGDIIFHKGKSFLSLGSLLNALQTDTDSTIVMNPKIMTQDGHTSNIFVGLNIPFVGSYVSNTSNNTTETSNIEYRDVGFNLTVTPTLGTNDIITLDINQDVSQVVDSSISFSGGTVTGIETSHATMTTRIHVPDRHFLILSGMLQDTREHAKQGLPCLGGLPLVGALFSQNNISDNKFNVIIFMKPYILHSMDEFDHLTQQEETLFLDDAVLPDVKETIDTGYERLKNIE
jgi:type III secretion protein C